ncbi:hypothetical protein VTK73DRAFT_3555 [Phialemonium thermophilum]|uniref:Uncharacterized protein n=1 Tax=Phialemonium thermophilum TaxID=223376 RepID=A0ABR3WYQ9_9PEZI
MPVGNREAGGLFRKRVDRSQTRFGMVLHRTPILQRWSDGNREGTIPKIRGMGSQHDPSGNSRYVFIKRILTPGRRPTEQSGLCEAHQANLRCAKASWDMHICRNLRVLARCLHETSGWAMRKLTELPAYSPYLCFFRVRQTPLDVDISANRLDRKRRLSLDSFLFLLGGTPCN